MFCSGATTLFFYANAKLFTLYGFFINSFVITQDNAWRRRITGASTASNLTFAAIALGFFVLQAGLLFVVARLFQVFGDLLRRVVFFLGLDGDLCGDDRRRAYGLCLRNRDRGDQQRLDRDRALLSGDDGTDPALKGRRQGRSQKELAVSSGALNYPLNPPSPRSPPPLNIVWLVAESLRWDMLDAEVMPST